MTAIGRLAISSPPLHVIEGATVRCLGLTRALTAMCDRGDDVPAEAVSAIAATIEELLGEISGSRDILSDRSRMI